MFIFIFILDPPQIVPFSFGVKSVNQGDFGQIICVVMRGDEPISITWSLQGDDLSSDPVMSTTMLGTRTSMLTIKAVNYRHSGTYTCRASNPGGVVTYSTDLVVNGKYSIKVSCRHWKLFKFYF